MKILKKHKKTLSEILFWIKKHKETHSLDFTAKLLIASVLVLIVISIITVYVDQKNLNKLIEM